MKIEVTPLDIAAGEVSTTRCPIALAAKRAYAPFFDDLDDLEIDCDGMFLGSEVVAFLPDTASQFIEQFDRGWPVDPIEFDMPFDPPEVAS